MSKELEALDSIMNTLCQRQMDLLADGTITVDEYDVIMKPFFDGNKLLKKALTPPTQEEVCKALSEYHLFDMVEYDKKTQTFYSGDNICYMGIDYQDKPIIIFDYELPPHLITLIGRFYEGLEK